MPIRHDALIPYLVTLVLAAPVAASCLQSARISAAKAAFAQQSLNLPDDFGLWKRVAMEEDSDQHDVITRSYSRKDEGNKVSIVVRQSPPIGLVHDLMSCFEANHLSPAIVEKVAVPTKDGHINAAVLTFREAKKKFVALTWFQQGADTAALRADWRFVGISRRDPNEPIRQAIVSAQYAKDPSERLAQLRELAPLTYSKLRIARSRADAK